MAEDTVRQIKEAADIVAVIGEHVSLTRAGANYKGRCPFHSEKTPSFIVTPARQSFHCFGCNEGGDVFSFLMKYHNLSFGEAMANLAQRFQITLPDRDMSDEDRAKVKLRQTLQDANEKAAALFHDFLKTSPQAEKARQYLTKRAMPASVIDRFRLGYAPDSWDFLKKRLGASFPPEVLQQAGLMVASPKGTFYDRFRDRILFPIVDMTGRVAGFGGRILGDGEPKYLNTDRTPLFDKGRILFGLYQNRQAIRQARSCIVVEGNFDMLSLVAHGIENVVAPLGTALTQAHIRTLKGYADEAVLLFDGDAAGLKAAQRSVPLFLTELVNARVSVLPKEHDPDTFVRQHGKDGLLEHLDQAMAMPEFVYDQLVAAHGLSLAGKGKIAAELGHIVAALPAGSVEHTLFIQHFGDKLGVAPEMLLEQPAPAVIVRRQEPPPPAAKLPIKHRQLLHYLLACPQMLPDFLTAGLKQVITNDTSLAIIDGLENLIRETPGAAPEELLGTLENAPRHLLSELLSSTQNIDEEDFSATGKMMLAWLRSTSTERQMKRLGQQIASAQAAGDITLALQLMTEKARLDQQREQEKSSN